MSTNAVTRRSLLKAAVMGAGTSLLAACARPTPAPTQPPAPAVKVAQPTAVPAAKQPVKLRVEHYAGNVEFEALKRMYEVYHKQAPHVSIEWIDASGGTWGIEKMMTMISGGDAPDIMMLNTGAFETFVDSNVLLPLDPLVASTKLDLGDYIPTALDAVKVNGKLYGLPQSAPDMVLWFNRDMFDKAKVAYPTNDWTWNELLDAAQKLTLDTNSDGKADQWGCSIGTPGWLGWIFVLSNGGQVMSSDFRKCLIAEPAAVEGAKFFFDKLGKYSPPPGALPELTWFGTWYQQQKVAMAIFASWYLQQLIELEKKFNWDCVQLPKAPSTGKRAHAAPLGMWGIYAQTKLVSEAFEFTKFLTDEDGMQTYVEVGGQYSPPVKAVLNSEKWLKRGGVNGQTFIDSMQYAVQSPQAFKNGAMVNSIWTQEVSLIVAGTQTTEQAMQKIAQRINADAVLK